MSEGVKELTPAGKLKRPSYETVATWVRDSWNAVDANLIKKSFKCCGISNNRDGTKDNLIFDYNRLGKTNRLNDGVEIPSDKDEEVQKSDDSEDDDEEGECDEEEDERDEGEDERDEEEDEYDEEDERDEEGDECNEEENESDEEFCCHYRRETNYVNIWE